MYVVFGVGISVTEFPAISIVECMSFTTPGVAFFRLIPPPASGNTCMLVL
jgi:hypothetical protein